MYDPLGSDSASAGFDGLDTVPPWPTTPHSPNSPIPNLRPAPTPDRISDINPFEKQAQIYGQPELGLISPATNPASNGNSFEKPEPYLKVRITGLDRNRRDILVRFDAQVSGTRTPQRRPRGLPRVGLCRRTCQISPAQRTETCRDHMWSSSNFAMPSYTTTHRRSSPPSHSHRRPPRQTKKMTD